MRKIIISATVAVVAAVSFAAPSEAGYYGYGYKKSHYAGGYKKTRCFIKKIRSYDYYGDIVIQRVRICR